MKNLKTLSSKAIGMLAFVFSMVLFTPTFSSTSDCELWTGNWMICQEDYVDTMAEIMNACEGALPPELNIMVRNCDAIIE
jgi:hypothetical protein